METDAGNPSGCGRKWRSPAVCDANAGRCVQCGGWPPIGPQIANQAIMPAAGVSYNNGGMKRKPKRKQSPPADQLPAPSKPGRKPMPIPDLIRIESVAAMGATNDQIAAAINVSPSTLKAMRKKYPSVEQVITRGKDKADLQVIGRLYKKALDGDTTAMIFWLKNRKPTEWRDRHNVDHGGNVAVDNKLIIEVVETKSK